MRSCLEMTKRRDYEETRLRKTKQRNYEQTNDEESVAEVNCHKCRKTATLHVSLAMQRISSQWVPPKGAGQLF